MSLIAHIQQKSVIGETGQDQSIPQILELGAQGGELFVAISLIFLLAYLDLLLASPRHHMLLRRMLQMGIIPLLISFGMIVLFESLTIV